MYSLEQAQETFGLEVGTNWSSIPDDEQTMVGWAKSVLFPSAVKASKILMNDGENVTA